MREKNVKEIVRYYYEIPEMVRLLKTEQREQESLYDTLKGTGGDGMPGGGGPGKPVEAAVIRLDERGVYERLQEIHVRLLVLEGEGTLKHQGETYAVKKGQSVFLPAGMGTYELTGRMQVLRTRV